MKARSSRSFNDEEGRDNRFVQFEFHVAISCARARTLRLPPIEAGRGLLPTLAAIMREIQFCHIKPSYAGQQSNWELANYEVAQIENNLSNALQLYQNIPIVKIKLIDQPLVDLSQAVNAKDKVRFVRAFTDMTNACNSCHEAANVSFISIQVPTSSPFSDQSFAPKKERSHP